jgi:hypothetical protein
MEAKCDGTGFDAILIAWRKATARAVLDFLDIRLSHDSDPRACQASTDGAACPHPSGVVTRGRAVGFGTGDLPAARLPAAGADGRPGRPAPHLLEHPLPPRQDQEAFVQQ